MGAEADRDWPLYEIFIRARSGLDHKHVEIDVREKNFPSFEIIAGSSVEEVDINVKDMLPGLFQGRTKKRKLRVPEALDALGQEEQHPGGEHQAMDVQEQAQLRRAVVALEEIGSREPEEHRDEDSNGHAHVEAAGALPGAGD